MKTKSADNASTISVVIPVYNTPPVSLEACVLSLVKQSSSVYEIILVDDGSDSSDCLQCLNNLESSFDNVYVVHENHCGVSASRNRGVAVATGDYILFVDSDDQVPPHMIERGKGIIADSGCDVAIGYVQYILKDAQPQELPNSNPRYALQDSSELLEYHLRGSSNSLKTYLSDKVVFKIGPVARLVKTDLAKRITFPENVCISEDTLWCVKLFIAAGRIVLVDDIWYWYFRGTQSASAGVHPTAAEDAKQCLLELDRIVSSNKGLLPEDAVLARQLGEISRVAKTWYSKPECKKPYIECTREMNELVDLTPRGSSKTLRVLLGNPVLTVKYILCRTGLFIHYWRLRRCFNHLEA